MNYTFDVLNIYKNFHSQFLKILPMRKFYFFLAMMMTGSYLHAQIIPLSPSAISKTKTSDPLTMPSTPNPYVNLCPPGTELDYAGWNRYLQSRAASQAAASSLAQSSAPKAVSESENTPGQNDTQASAQRINNFGTGRNRNNHVIINGFSGDPQAPPITVVPMNSTEDDGSIPLATITGITGLNQGVSYNETIGDSPGRLNLGVADFDMYAVTVPAGAYIEVDVNTPVPFGDLDPTVGIFFSNGVLVAFNDDGPPFNSFDSYLRYQAPVSGTFYISVGGFGAFVPADPFDSNSGDFFGNGVIGSEGDYEVIIKTMDLSDVDFYTFDLKKGDVFGAALDGTAGGAFLNIFDRKGEEEVGTNLNANSSYPSASPLPDVGQTSVSFIADKDGKFAIAVSNNMGAYSLELFATRPKLELQDRTVQTIYLDFNGGLVDVGQIFEFPPGIFLANHSPFRSFLSDWGLPDNDYTVRRITRKIIREVRDNLYTELEAQRYNRNLGVVIIGNDGTGRPTFFDPFIAQGSFQLGGITFEVSDIEVSGTIEESGISTIGIAQSIDLGNFATQEKALVLLDVLSAPASGFNANSTFSLNDVILAPGVSKEELVVTALANIIAHEAGHYLGNWHTDGLSDIQGIMDEGPGGLFNLIGVGPSGVFGGSDGIDVAFVEEEYSFNEIFTGTENTGSNTSFGLSWFPFGNYASYAAPRAIAEQLNPVRKNHEMILGQSYPNTLSKYSRADIKFQIEEYGTATVNLYDLSGNKVATLYEGDLPGGEQQSITLDARKLRLNEGVYIYKLETPYGEQHRKVIVTR